MRLLFTTAIALALSAPAAVAQSAMPTQTQIPQTAMPDPNQNYVPSDFGLWPPRRGGTRIVPPYHYVRPPPPPPSHATMPGR